MQGVRNHQRFAGFVAPARIPGSTCIDFNAKLGRTNPSRARASETRVLGLRKGAGSVGKHHSIIDDSLQKFIEAQPLFFVGSAPLDPEGSCQRFSERTHDTFRVLGPRTVAYLDLTGSGIETVSHLKENGRIVLMFCSFQGPPKIVRLHGQGTVIAPEKEEFPLLLAHFPEYEGTRAIILVEVSRISDSCGYSIPLLSIRSGA